jgi:PKD repeat protein
MTAAASRLASGATGHVLVAVAGFALGALLVWPLVSGLVPRPSVSEVAMISCPGDGSQVGVIRLGDQVLVTGRTADGAWVQVQYGGPGLARAYVPAGALTVAGDVATLPVVDCDARPAAGPRASLTAILDTPPSTQTPSEAPSVAPTSSPTPTATATATATALPATARPDAPRTKPPDTGQNQTEAPTRTPRRTEAATKAPTAAPTAPPTAPPTLPPPPPPHADFTKVAADGDWYTVAFTNTSTGDATSWAWDFDGDGEVDSRRRNPDPWHYTSPGQVFAKLTATGPGGSDDAIHAVNVPQGALAQFYQNVSYICVQGIGDPQSAVIRIKAWPGVASVKLKITRPDQSTSTYPMTFDGSHNRWTISVSRDQAHQQPGELTFYIRAIGPGDFTDRYPDSTVESLRLEACID